MAEENINKTNSKQFMAAKDRWLSGLARALPRWITPNVLTTFRILLVVPMYFVFQADQLVWVIVIFAVALFTDALDGVQARLLNKETTLGKLLDPAADKILFITLLLLVAPDRLSPAVVYVLLGLEATLVLLAVVIGPLVARLLKRKPKVGANNAGKIKMTLEGLAVLILLFGLDTAWVATVSEIMLWIASGFALLSIVLHLKLREEPSPQPTE